MGFCLQIRGSIIYSKVLSSRFATYRQLHAPNSTLLVALSLDVRCSVTNAAYPPVAVKAPCAYFGY